jgi:hypothetical protein
MPEVLRWGSPPHVSRRSTGITCTCLLHFQATHPGFSTRTHTQAASGMALRRVIFGRAHPHWQVTTPAAHESNGPGSGHSMYTPQPSQEVTPHLHHQQMPVTASAVPYQSAVNPHSLQGPGRYAQHMAAAHHSALHTPQPSQEAQPHLQHIPATAPAVTVPHQSALQPQPQYQPCTTDAQEQATLAQFAAPSLQSGAGDVFKTGNMGTSWQTPANANAVGSNGRDPWHAPSQAPITSSGPPIMHGLHPSHAFDMQNGSMC